MTDTETDPERTKIADRIRALLAKANSSEHEAEAHAFEKKAMELMAKHEIAERELADADRTIGGTEINIDDWGRAKGGVAALYQWIGDMVGAYAYQSSYKKSLTVRLFGTESQIESVTILMDHLLPQLRTDMVAGKPSSRKTFTLAWAHQVHARLVEAQAVIYSDCRALVPTNAAAKDKAERGLPDGQKIKPSKAKISNEADLDAGFAAGNAADLGQARVGA